MHASLCSPFTDLASESIFTAVLFNLILAGCVFAVAFIIRILVFVKWTGWRVMRPWRLSRPKPPPVPSATSNAHSRSAAAADGRLHRSVSSTDLLPALNQPRTNVAIGSRSLAAECGLSWKTKSCRQHPKRSRSQHSLLETGSSRPNFAACHESFENPLHLYGTGRHVKALSAHTNLGQFRPCCPVGDRSSSNDVVHSDGEQRLQSPRQPRLEFVSSANKAAPRSSAQPFVRDTSFHQHTRCLFSHPTARTVSAQQNAPIQAIKSVLQPSLETDCERFEYVAPMLRIPRGVHRVPITTNESFFLSTSK
ncbi:unnamed protein product [Protopolystoma xenopodis]|uniref:Uncharacterized protein n=1 Tax=Protopolystoma xenopodis TaxID=117903 RepID=A0A3S5FG80_9PLAT|nr:unnamed protein product [Protopolystoma xenopodis]